MKLVFALASIVMATLLLTRFAFKVKSPSVKMLFSAFHRLKTPVRSTVAALLTRPFALPNLKASYRSFFTSSASPQLPTSTLAKYRKDYKPSAFQLPNVSLTFQLSGNETTVMSNLHLTVKEPVRLEDDLVLDGEDLELRSVKINGRTLNESEYFVSPISLTIKKNSVLSSLDSSNGFRLSIEVKISPEKNLALSGLYQSQSQLLLTQCEAMGFRRIVYHLDRPDVLSTFEVRLEADKNSFPVLLSNGNCVDKGDLADTNRHYAVWKDPFPKPSYLFALVAGNLDHISSQYTTKSGRNVSLGIYSSSENKPKLEHAMYR